MDSVELKTLNGAIGLHLGTRVQHCNTIDHIPLTDGAKSLAGIVIKYRDNFYLLCSEYTHQPEVVRMKYNKDKIHYATNILCQCINVESVLGQVLHALYTVDEEYYAITCEAAYKLSAAEAVSLLV